MKKVIKLQGKIIDKKSKKISIDHLFWFFQPLLNFSESWLLVTCITNLDKVHEKLLKLSRPQGEIIDIHVKC